MRRGLAMALAAAVALLGTACGGEKAAETGVDLTALYTAIAEDLDWDGDYMAEIEGDLLESYYPGLSALDIRQLIARTPAMSSDVNELVFLECGTEEDGEAAETILQSRADSQAGGGAWYAESMEAWENAAVIREGRYVALIASAAHQSELEQRFRDAFA